jgi:ketosteroid isomerase-like protein
MNLARAEEAIRAVVEFNAAFNRHDAAGMARLLTEDCILEHFAPGPGGSRLSGRAEIAKHWEAFFTDHPGVRMQAEELLGSGFRCTMRWRLEWNDAAQGASHLRGVDVFKVRMGLICEELAYCKA